MGYAERLKCSWYDVSTEFREWDVARSKEKQANGMEKWEADMESLRDFPYYRIGGLDKKLRCLQAKLDAKEAAFEREHTAVRVECDRFRKKSAARLKAHEETLSELSNTLACPITKELMEQPVIHMKGHTYERSALAQWFRTGTRFSDPKTNLDIPLDTNGRVRVYPNHTVKAATDTLQECKRKLDVQERTLNARGMSDKTAKNT